MPPDDLGTIAENALNEMEAADANDEQDDTQTNEQLDKDDSIIEGGEEDAEKSEASEDTNEDDPDKDEEGEDDPAKGATPQGKQAQELTDEELLAELEKRGKKPEAKEEKREAPRPTEVPDDVWNDMNDFQRTVYNRLPFMEIRDDSGNTYRIKHNSQVPKDFPWESEEAKNQFYGVDLPAQSVVAERIGMQLQGLSKQQQEQARAQQEANEVVQGIDKLQEQGIVPKITAKPNTPEFDNDPGVKRANDILSLWGEYRNRGEMISIETAGRIFKAENPDLYKPKTSPADAERRKASRNIAGTAGSGTAGDPNDKTSGRAWPIGTTAADIADAYQDQLD